MTYDGIFTEGNTQHVRMPAAEVGYLDPVLSAVVGLAPQGAGVGATVVYHDHAALDRVSPLVVAGLLEDLARQIRDKADEYGYAE